MARIARVVAPGISHHITQRGNRRQETFFCNDDYERYKELMSRWCIKRGVDIWAYCLMPNHVHLIAVPDSEESLRIAIGEAHRRYTGHINFRENWRGHLWQSRFASYPMDESYLLAAAKYIEMNPVRAGLSVTPVSYRWSSADAHLSGSDDGLVKAGPLSGIVGDWKAFLEEAESEPELKILRLHERTGRPLGSDNFLFRLEDNVGRILKKQKHGSKGNNKNN